MKSNYCELHVHLEGCIWPSHVFQWWTNSKCLFPPPSYRRQNTFDNFLEHIRFGYNFLNNPEAYASVICNYANRAIIQGIRYAEVQMNLALLRTFDLDIEAVIESMNTALEKLSDGPTVRYIIDMPWQFRASGLDCILKNFSILKPMGVVGISMGGDERLANIDEVADVFSNARTLGLKTMCHAGEITDYGFAKELISALAPDRVAHAISLAPWITELGVKSPPIDVCLTSNLLLGLIQNYHEHPLKQWYDAGVNFSISTDDPAIFNTDLNREYEIADRLIPNYSENKAVLTRNWLSAAFDANAIQELMSLK